METCGRIPRETIARIPLIDLRRIERYGPCDGRPGGRRCSKRAHRDDIHFERCSLSASSKSMICLEWR